MIDSVIHLQGKDDSSEEKGLCPAVENAWLTDTGKARWVVFTQ